MCRLTEMTVSAINELYEEIKTVAHTQAQQDGIDTISEFIIQNKIAMRFLGQSYELMITWKNDIGKLRNDFLKLHKKEYGFASDTEPMELVALRSTVIIPHPDPVLKPLSTMEPPSIL